MAGVAGPCDGVVSGWAAGDDGWDVQMERNLEDFDAWNHAAVLGLQDAPPVSPTAGDRYLIGTGSGAWADHDGELALWRGGVWLFKTPKIGWRIWRVDLGRAYVLTGSGVVPELAGTDLPDHTHAAGQGANIPAASVTGLGALALVASPCPLANGGTASANASDARTALGLAIGSNVQAYDAGLASIAGVALAADKALYFTADNVAAAMDMTAAGRALLDDANATAQRATLGLGAAAVLADPVPIANGGTGQTTLAAAGLGYAVGTPVNLTGQTGNIADQTLLATGHAAGFYTVLLNVLCTYAGAAGSLTYCQVKWGDGAAHTNTVTMNNSGAGSSCLLTNTIYAADGASTFYSDGSAAITCNTANGTYTTNPTYTFRGRLRYSGA